MVTGQKPERQTGRRRVIAHRDQKLPGRSQAGTLTQQLTDLWRLRGQTHTASTLWGVFPPGLPPPHHAEEGKVAILKYASNFLFSSAEAEGKILYQSLI